MTDQSELQGQVAALLCFVSSVTATLPLACQMRVWPTFENRADAVRAELTGEALRGFEQATVELSARRRG